MSLFENLITFCKKEELIHQTYESSIVTFQLINCTVSGESLLHNFIFDFKYNKNKFNVLCFSNICLDQDNLKSFSFCNYFNKISDSNSLLLIKDFFCLKQTVYSKYSEKIPVDDLKVWRDLIHCNSNTLANIENFYFNDLKKTQYKEFIPLDSEDFELFLLGSWNIYQEKKEILKVFTEEHYEKEIQKYNSNQLNTELDKLLENYSENIPKLKILQKYLKC